MVMVAFVLFTWWAKQNWHHGWLDVELPNLWSWQPPYYWYI